MSRKRHPGTKNETRYYLHIDNQRRRLYGPEEVALATAKRWAEGRAYYVTSEVRTVILWGTAHVTPLPHPDPPIL